MSTIEDTAHVQPAVRSTNAPEEAQETAGSRMNDVLERCTGFLTLFDGAAEHCTRASEVRAAPKTYAGDSGHRAHTRAYIQMH